MALVLCSLAVAGASGDFNIGAEEELAAVPTESRALFRKVLGRLEVMHGEMNGLRADKDMLAQRVARLEEKESQCGCEEKENENENEEKEQEKEGAGELLSTNSTHRRTQDYKHCGNSGDLDSALTMIQDVCCTQSAEECEQIIGKTQWFPSTCVTPACACAIRHVNTDCVATGQLAEQTDHHVMDRLVAALATCAASVPPDPVTSYTPSISMDAPLIVTGCSGRVTDGCGQLPASSNGLRYAHIVAPMGWRVQLTPTLFSMGQGDIIQLYDGPDVGSPELAELRGSNLKAIPSATTSSGGEMYLMEVTDETGVNDGYSFTLSCVCDGCDPGACVLNGNPESEVCGEYGTCNRGTERCDCAPGWTGLYCDTYDATSCDSEEEFALRSQQVMGSCCPSSSAGGGHRRLQADCSLPDSCPSEECATEFIAFFGDCRGLLDDTMLARFAPLEQDCRDLSRVAQLKGLAVPTFGSRLPPCETGDAAALAYSSQNGFQTLMTCSAVGGTAAWRRVKIFTIDYGNDVHRFVVDVSSGESGPFSVELVEDTGITADLPITFGQTVSITGQGSVAESVALQTGKDICPGTGDLRSFASDSTTECSQACYDDARCAAFVLRVDGSLCYLKSCSLLVVDDPNAVLGVIRASTRWGSGGFTVQQSASLIWTNLAVEGDAAVYAGGTLEVFSSTVSSHISVVGGSFTGQDSTFISNVDVAAGGTAGLTRCTLGTDAFGDTAGALITVTGGSSLSITSVVMPGGLIPRLTDTGSTLQLDDVAFQEVPDSLTHRLAGTVTVEADGSTARDPPGFMVTSLSFAVSSGPCAVSEGGRCVGRPNGYMPNEQCTITVVGFGVGLLGPCPVFDTESYAVMTDGGDYLTLPDGSNFRDCPLLAALADGDSVSWRSNLGSQGSTQCNSCLDNGCAATDSCGLPESSWGMGGGWQICFLGY